MNSKLNYLYRDASNYKWFHSEIVSGELSLPELQRFLYEGFYFIPSEVGLTNLQPEVSSIDDHIWHEIESVEIVSDMPTLACSAEKLVLRFKAAYSKEWNLASLLRNSYL